MWFRFPVSNFQLYYIFMIVLINLCTRILAVNKVGNTVTSKYSSSSGINIRIAQLDDIKRINQCNLDNLPENYSHYFYINHLTKWLIV